MIASSESHAMRRLVADASRTEATLKALKSIDEPMARSTALLVAGLVASKSDAVAFLQELLP